MPYGSKQSPIAVPVGTAPTLILPALPGRISALIVNNSSQTLYVGKDATVTTSNGTPVSAGASLSDEDSSDAWYGIVASGTADIRVTVVEQ